ncbi:MAG: UDP-4-amino-4,6-dideoxy-N-acetyl-beta-L-altrosamine transaminase [Alphaproteobacteria bacterium]|nr:UDP-4-amino-4,6-dideoxy-N-acetyl-beta-L-altrosamine transaminase [Alphaproteobacteria bacterium]
MTAKAFLPYGRQSIDEDDIAAVSAVLRGDWLTTGPAVTDFEAAFARRVNAPYALSCSSGTAALHLATLAAGIGPGDLAVVPSVTFVATANCVRYVGGDVVFADVDPDSGLMTPETFLQALERAPTPPKAVFPVDLAGQVGAAVEIAAMAGERGMVVIEDACHALGSVFEDGEKVRTVGSCSHSDFCVFSFHPVKAIAMGEGGVVTCRDSEQARAVLEYRNHGLTRDSDRYVGEQSALNASDSLPWYYELQSLGYNYRASDLHCALGLSQLKKLDRFLSTRLDLVARYDDQLAGLAPLVRTQARVGNRAVGWHLMVALIEFEELGTSRQAVMRGLHSRGIGTQVHYIPVHRQPYYRNRYGQTRLSGADRYYERCLSLPLSSEMALSDVDRVVEALRDVLGL